MAVQDDILMCVEKFGPLVPADLVSHTGKDTIILGAVLGDLASSGKVLLTNAKWGGSPLYYLPSQIEGIQKLYPKLNEKDRRAFDLLKEHGVLRDRDMTPLVRTCLRALKDFAMPMKWPTADGEEIFWRWYLQDEAEARSFIKETFFPEPKKEVPVVEKQSDQSIPSTSTSVLKPSSQSSPATQSPIIVTPVSSTPIVTDSTMTASHLATTSGSPAQTAGAVSAPTKDAPKRRPKKAASAHVSHAAQTTQTAATTVSSHASHETQITLTQTVSSVDSASATLVVDDEWVSTVKTALIAKNVSVVSSTVIRKNAEADFIIIMPTPLGNMRCFVKARKKKKSNEADLSATYVKAMMQHLQGIYLSQGDITKKAVETMAIDFPGLMHWKI